MRDPELVFKAQLAASALERAWQRWRVMHGLVADPMPAISSYVGYSLEEPWGQPRVVFGLSASDAEQLAALLNRHDCIGPVHATIAGQQGRETREVTSGAARPLPVPPQAPSVVAEQSSGGDVRSLGKARRPAGTAGESDGPVYRQVARAAREAARQAAEAKDAPERPAPDLTTGQPPADQAPAGPPRADQQPPADQPRPAGASAEQPPAQPLPAESTGAGGVAADSAGAEKAAASNAATDSAAAANAAVKNAVTDTAATHHPQAEQPQPEQPEAEQPQAEQPERMRSQPVQRQSGQNQPVQPDPVQPQAVQAPPTQAPAGSAPAGQDATAADDPATGSGLAAEAGDSAQPGLAGHASELRGGAGGDGDDDPDGPDPGGSGGSRRTTALSSTRARTRSGESRASFVTRKAPAGETRAATNGSGVHSVAEGGGPGAGTESGSGGSDEPGTEVYDANARAETRDASARAAEARAAEAVAADIEVGQAADGPGPLALAASAARVAAEARIRAAMNRTRSSVTKDRRVSLDAPAKAQVPAAQVPADQVPPAQVPPAQLPAAQVPAAQIPPARVPAAQVPPAQFPAAHFFPPWPEVGSGARARPFGEPDHGYRDEDDADVASAWGGPGFTAGENSDPDVVPLRPRPDDLDYDAGEDPDLAAEERAEHSPTAYARRNRITRGYSIPRLSRSKRPGAVPGL
jgi:hypothetical protein